MYGLTPSQIHGDLGVTKPAEKINGAQAFGIELLLTFVLIFTIFAASDPGKEHRGYEIPLSIGLCVFICHIVGVGTKAIKYSKVQFKVLSLPPLICAIYIRMIGSALQ